MRPEGAHALAADTHLYLLSLSALASPGRYDRALSLMSAPEREAYDRIKAPGRRAEYALGRYATRRVVAACAGVPAGALVIEPGPSGKPRVTGPAASLGARFNVSHSGDLLAIAVCRDDEVGVDVERLDERLLPDVEAIARRHFVPDEQRSLAGSLPARRLAEFFRMWTLKEAVLKAVGAGLSQPLTRVAVPAPRAHYRIGWPVESGETTLDARHWHDLVPGYHVAVARVGRLAGPRVFHGLAEIPSLDA
jgi:4'-phosphopantetheinyl transferase